MDMVIMMATLGFGCALSGLTSTSGQLWDQHVRSIPARLVCVTSVSGRCFAASRCATGASGQCDQRVRSTRFRLFKFLTAIFKGVRL
jgi:hypothetical protein